MKNINQNDFEHLTQNHGGLAVLDFWAPWCGPCLRMTPIFQTVSEQPEFSHIQFLKINVDDNPEFRQQFGIRTIPSFFVVKFDKSGKFLDQHILARLGGSQLPAEMIEKIKQATKID
jgi:thioredoxin 1